MKFLLHFAKQGLPCASRFPLKHFGLSDLEAVQAAYDCYTRHGNASISEEGKSASLPSEESQVTAKRKPEKVKKVVLLESLN